MKKELERDLGEQPIIEILQENNLQAKDLVNISTEQISFKMISRACKGRRLSVKVQMKILTALNILSKNDYKRTDLFNY